MDTSNRGKERDYRRYFLVTAVLLIFGMLSLGVAYAGAASSSASRKYADLTLTVLPNFQPGIDSQHAIFAPTNFTVYVGQVVNLTVVNYNVSQESFTSPGLGVSFVFSPASPGGVPSVSHFQFVATASGTFEWWCGFCHTMTGQYADVGHPLAPGQPDLLKGTFTVLG